MVICLEQGADLHMAQLMPLPLTVSCFRKIQIGFTFLVPAHLGSPGKEPLDGCVCVCLYWWMFLAFWDKKWLDYDVIWNPLLECITEYILLMGRAMQEIPLWNNWCHLSGTFHCGIMLNSNFSYGSSLHCLKVCGFKLLTASTFEYFLLSWSIHFWCATRSLCLLSQ